MRANFLSSSQIHPGSGLNRVIDGPLGPYIGQVAGMEDSYLDQPPLQRIVPPMEGILGRLVLVSRKIGGWEAWVWRAEEVLIKSSEGE